MFKRESIGTGARYAWKAILIGSLAIVAFVILFFLSGIGEGYCYFYPAIGTDFARGYSEERFEKVNVGNSADAVLRLLGPPLHSQGKQNGTIEWYYTQDKVGKFDFAWLGRIVTLSNDVVILKERRVFYD